MSNVFNKNMDSDYYDKVQALYNDNPLFSEETKNTNYNKDRYIDSSKYKPSSSSSKVSSISLGKTDKKSAIINIPLNMSIPNMDDLIN